MISGVIAVGHRETGQHEQEHCQQPDELVGARLDEHERARKAISQSSAERSFSVASVGAATAVGATAPRVPASAGHQ